MFRLVQGFYGSSGGGGGPTSTVNFTADTSTRFLNPECNWYAWPASPTYLQSFTASNLSGIRTSSPYPATMVMALWNLGPYVTTATLPSAHITDAYTRFGYLRSAGLKCIIRPVYNYTTGGADATLSIAMGHQSQLEQCYADNADVICWGQLGVFGDYGEFHDGSSGNAQNQASKLAIMQAMMDAFPSTHQVAARYAADARTWFPTVLTQSQYLAGLTSSTYQTRLGLFNDGYLAGASDSGTYDNRTGSNSLTIAQAQSYDAALSAFNVNGGEVTTFAGTPYRTALSDAQNDGQAYHMGYLNNSSGSGPAFFTAWSSNGAGAWIGANYGYRFQLDSLTYPASSLMRGASVALSVALRNNGCARIPLQRLLVASLQHTTTGEIYTATADDLRKLPSRAIASTTMAASVAIPADATTGTYQVLLSAPDVNASIASDVRYAARFANANAGAQAWDATNARFNTGATVVVS